MAHSDLATIHFIKGNESQPSIKGVITIQMQCARCPKGIFSAPRFQNMLTFMALCFKFDFKSRKVRVRVMRAEEKDLASNRLATHPLDRPELCGC